MELLVAAGDGRLVREYRERFEEHAGGELKGLVEDLTQRRVLAYHSQLLLLEPIRLIGVFVLDEPVAAHQPPA